MAQNEALTKQYLICRSDDRLCALPLDYVSETMRSLPIEAMPGMPGFVLGAAIVRDEVIPVVDVSALLAARGQSAKVRHARFVTLKLHSAQHGERHIALAVDNVIGVRSLEHIGVGEMAPLLSGAHVNSLEAAITLDAELLLVLQAAHLIPETVWQQFNEGQQNQQKVAS